MVEESKRALVRRIPVRNIEDGRLAPEPISAGHRRTAGVRGQCALCEQSTALLLGHIIPRWAVRMLSPGLIHGTVNGQTQYFVSQDGAKEYLFCAACEQRLGEAENYLAAVCRGTARSLRSIGVTVERGGTLHGVDERLIVRALLGVCLKAHLAEEGTFKRVRLDRAFVPSVKRQLLSDAYPDHLYFPHAIKWMNLLGSGALPRDLLYVSTFRTPEEIGCSISLGGMKFQMLFRSTLSARRRVDLSPDAYLAPRRPWNVVVADISHDVAIQERIAERQPDLPKSADAFSLSPEIPCPCGLSASTTYKDCCLGRWYPSAARIGGLLYDPAHECAAPGTGSLCTFPEPTDRFARTF